MDDPKKIETNLDIIRVVSRDGNDTVYLQKPVELLAFKVWCGGRHSRIWINHKKLKPMGDGIWRAVAEAYIIWKRTTIANFKAANYHGHLKDGRQHPWTRGLRRGRKPQPPEDEEPPET